MGILLSPLLLGFSRPSSRKRSPVQHFLQARVKRIVPAKEASPRRAGGCRCRSLSAAHGIAGRAFAGFVDGDEAVFPVFAAFLVVECGLASAPLRLTESVAPSLPRWLLPRRMVVKGKKRGLPPGNAETLSEDVFQPSLRDWAGRAGRVFPPQKCWAGEAVEDFVRCPSGTRTPSIS